MTYMSAVCLARSGPPDLFMYCICIITYYSETQRVLFLYMCVCVCLQVGMPCSSAWILGHPRRQTGETCVATCPGRTALLPSLPADHTIAHTFLQQVLSRAQNVLPVPSCSPSPTADLPSSFPPLLLPFFLPLLPGVLPLPPDQQEAICWPLLLQTRQT